MASSTERHAALQGLWGLDYPYHHSFHIESDLQIITIGDCSKGETRKYFQERVIPRVPEHLRRGLNFEHLYEAFGGKFAHWYDYITDYGRSLSKLSFARSQINVMVFSS